MPVEIRELIIRATVVNSSQKDSSAKSSAGAASHDATVAACVAQVLKILARKRER